MQRRSFMAGLLAAATAPALVRAGVLMPVRSIAVPSAIIDAGAAGIYNINDPGHTHTLDAMRYMLDPRDGRMGAFSGIPPQGWLPCDGRVIDASKYPALAGLHMHRLPDLRNLQYRHR